MTQYFTPPQGLGQLSTDMGNDYLTGLQVGQKNRLIQLEEQKTQQSQALQNLKMSDDPNQRAMAMRLDPEYAKQYKEYQLKQAEYIGNQAKSISKANLADRPGLYTSAYNSIAANGEDMGDAPLPPKDGKWTEAHQGFVEHLANSSVGVKDAMQLDQTKLDEDRKFGLDETEKDRRFGLDKTEKDRRFGLDSRFKDSEMATKALEREKLKAEIKQKEAANKEGISDFAYKKQQEEIGKRRGETINIVNSLGAKLPQLLNTVNRLSTESNKATYTKAGKGYDWLMKEGLGKATEGAESRTKYESIVSNEILPILRDTFGAQFTQKEGESLKATLGDPDKTPPEKEAILQAFIDSKIGSLNSMGIELGIGEINPSLKGEGKYSIEKGKMILNKKLESKTSNLIGLSDDELLKQLNGTD